MTNPLVRTQAAAMAASVALIAAMAAGTMASCNDGKGGPAAASAGPSTDDLEKMKAESARIMPKTFSEVWVGMPEKELTAARPEAVAQPHRSDPLERRWYMETSLTGVRVWYGVNRDTSRLAVVQFAHQFLGWSDFQTHAVALQDRFGTDYELYQCPAGGGTSDQGKKTAMTRLLWPRKPVSVMEAILEMSGNVSVTMIVASPQDCLKGIEKQQCTRVDRDKALESWIETMVGEEQKKLEAGEGHGKGFTGPLAPPSAGLPDPTALPPGAKPVPAPAEDVEPGPAK